MKSVKMTGGLRRIPRNGLMWHDAIPFDLYAWTPGDLLCRHFNWNSF